jgi:hypothetical protein
LVILKQQLTTHMHWGPSRNDVTDYHVHALLF